MVLTVAQVTTMLATPVAVGGICGQVELSLLQFPFSDGCAEWKGTVSRLDGLLCSAALAIVDPYNAWARNEEGQCEIGIVHAAEGLWAGTFFAAAGGYFGTSALKHGPIFISGSWTPWTCLAGTAGFVANRQYNPDGRPSDKSF